ncbi:diguanylate cyclase [Thalassotalea marina]|uniref:diguanylate cyclase n=1 Tax=Thalassotalea marina TaxID=1673741 RepID=UPI0016763A7D|nr:diguanylate cyclase [Thalassotalea marina]
MTLLISCDIYAQKILTTQEFDQFIEQVELKKDTNVKQAFDELITQEAYISELPTEKQLIFYRLKAELYVEQGKYLLGKSLATKALDLSRSLPHPSITASEILYARGFSHESLGDYDAAREDYLNGLEIADSLNNKKIVAIGLINLGALDYLLQKFDRSLIMFNDALAIANEVKDNELLGFVYAEFGILYSFLGQDDKSMLYYIKSKDYYLEAGKSLYAFNTLRNLASNYAAKNNYDKAIELFQEIIDNKEKITNNELLAFVYTGMAWAQIKQKDKNPEASYEYMKIAGEYMQHAEQVDVPINYALEKGYLFLELERYDEALTSLEEATKLFKLYENNEEKITATISKLNVLYLSGELHYKLGNYQKAYQSQEEMFNFAVTLPEKNNIEEVEELRMRYESQQADIDKKLLDQEQYVQAISLAETQRKLQNRQWYLVLFAIVSIVLAWALIKVVKGQRKLIDASRTDALTQIANRRHLMSVIEKQFEEATTNQTTLSLVMIDVDDFKTINDKFGHKVGDNVLIKVASIGAKLMRSSDTFGRFGGEEFIAVLPQTSAEDAFTVAERIRVNVYEQYWGIEELGAVSLSLGVVTYENGNFDNCEELFKQADQLLYQAKRSGKNRVHSD